MEPTDPNQPNETIEQSDAPIQPIDPVQPFEPEVLTHKKSLFEKLFSILTGPMTRQKMVLLGGFLLIAILIALGSFWIGLRGQQTTSEPSASPTPAIEATITPDESVTETPTDEPAPSDSPTPTSTPKPSPTNSPTSTNSPTATLTPTPSTQTQTITSQAALDGFESTNGGGNTTADIQAGRNNTLATRGFVSFPLNSIPSGKTIDQATIRLYQKSKDGSPYVAGGNLMLDHLNYGSTLDNSDYNIAAILASFTTLSTSATTGEWREADVTDRVRDDIANSRTNSQYRLHFSTETIGGDVTGDFAHFEAADTGSGTIPQLFIRYH